MAVRYLLDTNICIYIRRQRPPEILERFTRLTPGEAGISIITFGELSYGAQKSQSPTKAEKELGNLMSALPVLPLTAGAAGAYGEIRTDLEKRGEIIGGNDLWIAAHAMSSDLILVTNNEREFRRVRGLKLENWAAA
jgi:tRNA(fMet)-specific endonuclease VapC